MFETAIDRHLSKSLSQNKQIAKYYIISYNGKTSISYYYDIDSELIVR